ncbi:unnamed protein product [Lactuca saligna]|uniref:Uncharacterized protein n=1 Tax=Lactuca saligna TaxID=75948 RepID=A0AA36A0R5_LACSI|nr:unnamed protein product [Lactuca saligna]
MWRQPPPGGGGFNSGQDTLPMTYVGGDSSNHDMATASTAAGTARIRYAYGCGRLIAFDGLNTGYNVDLPDDLYFIQVFAGDGITGGLSNSEEMAEQKSTKRVAVPPEILTTMLQGGFLQISCCHDIRWRSPSSMGWYSGSSVVGDDIVVALAGRHKGGEVVAGNS